MTLKEAIEIVREIALALDEVQETAWGLRDSEQYRRESSALAMALGAMVIVDAMAWMQ